MKEEKSEKDKALNDLLIDIAYELKDLMESNCQNSGLNWLDNFREKLEKWYEIKS